MVVNRREKAWAEALRMVSSGDFKKASHVEDLLRSKGYAREVNRWREDESQIGDIEGV